MIISDKITSFFNRGKGNRITEGSPMTRPQGTVIITQPRRFGITLDDYMLAIRSAENVDLTQRTKLYDLYAEAVMDPHLFSVIQKRKSGTVGKRIEFRRNGVADDRVNAQIASPWFLRFVEDVIDSQFWGFTLVQFYINEQGWIDYFLIPRKHVDPVLRLIKTRQTDIFGHSFDEYTDLVMIQGKEPLGILARTTPYVIYKRGTLGDWAQFSEIFGMPTRLYTYDSADPGARQEVLSAAEQQGGANVFICPDGTKLEFPEAGNKTGSSDLYAALIDRCNAEMSKAVLGNTLTTEASETGTQALGTVHSKVEEELIRQDGLFVLNVLNYEMADQFAALGVNTSGGEFVFVEEETMTTKEKAEVLSTAYNTFHLPIADDYLYETLKIEKQDNYDELKRQQEEKSQAQTVLLNNIQNDGRQDTDPNKQPQNRLQGFFVNAPQDGALKW